MVYQGENEIYVLVYWGIRARMLGAREAASGACRAQGKEPWTLDKSLLTVGLESRPIIDKHGAAGGRWGLAVGQVATRVVGCGRMYVVQSGFIRVFHAGSGHSWRI